MNKHQYNKKGVCKNCGVSKEAVNYFSKDHTFKKIFYQAGELWGPKFFFAAGNKAWLDCKTNKKRRIK